MSGSAVSHFILFVWHQVTNEPILLEKQTFDALAYVNKHVQHVTTSCPNMRLIVRHKQDIDPNVFTSTLILHLP